MKQEKADKAEDDCSRALLLDPAYVKAWSRRGLARFKRGKYADSAADFHHAMGLDPENKELPQLFQKATDKYAEVEGKGAWVPPGQVAASRGEDGASSERKAEPSPPRASAAAGTVVPLSKAATAADLLLPSPKATVVASGRCALTVARAPPAAAAPAPSSSAAAGDSSSGFTRVAITFDDDDDDDDDDRAAAHGEPVQEEKGSPAPSPAASPAAAAATAAAAEASGFTRVQIVEEDSSDEEKQGTSDAAAAPTPMPPPPPPPAAAPAPVHTPADYSRMTFPELVAALGELDKRLVRAPQDEGLRAERTKVAQLVRVKEKEQAADKVKEVTPPLPPTPPATVATTATTTAAATAADLPPAPPAAAAAPTSTAAPAAKKASVRAPAVPTEAPKTMYEFERVWRGLKDHPDRFGQYLGTFTKKVRAALRGSSLCTGPCLMCPALPCPAVSPTHLVPWWSQAEVKKVMKEAVSPELMSSVFKALRDHCPAPVVATVLGGLSQTAHFSMLLRLMEAGDLECVKTTFFNLLRDDSVDPPLRATLQQLQQAYNLG